MFRLVLFLIFAVISLPAFAACDPKITLDVDRPIDGEADPTVVGAVATSECRITAIRVYVDYKLIYEQHGQNYLNARLVMGPGTHRVVTQAWNSAGQLAKDVRYITTNADPVEPPAGCEIFELRGAQYTGDHIPSTAQSPIRTGMVANAEEGRVTSMRLYIDGVDRAQTWGTTGYCLPVALMSLSPGYHFINVQAWTSLGPIFLTGSIVQVVP